MLLGVQIWLVAGSVLTGSGTDEIEGPKSVLVGFADVADLSKAALS